MKKIFALILALAMALSLVACGGSSTATTDTTEKAGNTLSDESYYEDESYCDESYYDESYCEGEDDSQVVTTLADPVTASSELTAEQVASVFVTTYMGLGNTEYESYAIAFNQEGNYGMVVYYNELYSSYLILAGEVTFPDTDTLAINDLEENMNLTFGVEKQENGDYYLDLGNCGSATVGASDPVETAQKMLDIASNADNLTNLLAQ